MSTGFQLYLVLGVFGAVILSIAFDAIDLCLAAMVGTVIYLMLGTLDGHDVIKVVQSGGGTLALLFGGMVVARALLPTGLFDLLATRLVWASAGQGRTLLLGMVGITAVLCAVLPNATVVLLMAPVMIRAAQALRLDFVPIIVVLVTVSNAAGLLTLVGDPATFIVGSSIHLSFAGYLHWISAGGILALLTIVALLPWLLRAAWTARTTIEVPDVPAIQRPSFVVAALATLGLMVVLFVFGENLPIVIGPPAVSIVAATVILLALYAWNVEPVERVFADIDWRTLIFIFCMLMMVEALVKTGALATLAGVAVSLFGKHFALMAIALLVGVGTMSAFLANVPVVLALVLVTKGYFVALHVVPEDALGHTFDWPLATLPVFAAMMFGATLGGNATVIGASANIVAAGISARHGEPLGFVRFFRIGAPIAAAQLAVAALYVLALLALLS
jgi:Na+/H+ antiporter NhaD/arsenite permease-like protein